MSLAAGCSTFGLGDEQPTATTPPRADPLPAGVEVTGSCDAAEDGSIVDVDGVTAASVAAAMFPCATGGVVAHGEAPSRLVQVAAAGLAARLGLPLFDNGRDAIARSGPELLLVTDEASAADLTGPGVDSIGIPLSGLGPAELATSIAAHTHDFRVVLLPDDVPLEIGLRVVAHGGGILLPEPEVDQLLALHDAGFKLVTTGPPRSLDVAPFPIAVGSVTDPGRSDRRRDLWLVGALPAAPLPWLDLVSALGRDQLVVAAPDDPREDTALQRLLADMGGDLGTIRHDRASTGWARWQLRTVLGGTQLPGGGYTLFPHRRFVALYGHPEFGGLGILGEQSPAAAVELARQVAAQYASGGVPVVPAFDIITTLASSGPTPDGDYSAPIDKEILRPWIEAATQAGFYVTLDFQPGRSSYMDQVPLYEEFLRLPNVGVALDPEWRLLPDQVHLRQVGSLDAAEVNAVAEYLAGLVREHDLPQKLLVVHQFQLRMIRNRDTLEHPPELAVVIHMDGQGPISTKDETYRVITTGFEERVWWGWKNFYDEDSPTPSPEHTLSRMPSPVFISYQ